MSVEQSVRILIVIRLRSLSPDHVHIVFLNINMWNNVPGEKTSLNKVVILVSLSTKNILVAS